MTLARFDTLQAAQLYVLTYLDCWDGRDLVIVRNSRGFEVRYA